MQFRVGAIITGVLGCASPLNGAMRMKHAFTTDNLSLRLAIAVVVILSSMLPRLSAHEKVDFNRQIRPILSNNCFRCHGPDASHRRADLRLDDFAAATAKRDGTSAIVPGKPAESEVFRRVNTADADERMPPPDSGLNLSENEVELLRRWIAEGAVYQPHWAFIAPHAARLPAIRQTSLPINPIDHFVLARLEAAGLRPASEAGKESLLRRVTLDLTGFPPSPSEMDAFLADHDGDAYEKVVDRLLHSPRYGEHMAVEWLDAARYGDTNGYFTDAERKLWRWRDWVIGALNANMPFDRFTIEQLAGDLLPGATQDQLIATGFNRNHPMNNESGIIDEEYRVEYVADRNDTTGTVWLGLTVGCARCHDHKFDPLTQAEYYQLFAFFNNLPEKGLIYSETPPEPALAVLTSADEDRRNELKEMRGRLEKQFAPHEAALQPDVAKWEAAAKEDLTPSAVSESLLAHFDFDDRLTDDSRQNVQPISSGPLRYKDGYRKSALEFDGSQHVDLPADLGLDPRAPWTIAFWTRPLPIARGPFLSVVDPQDPQRGLSVVSQRLHVAVSLAAIPNDRVISVVTTRPLKAAQWQHVAISYDGSGKAEGFSLFVDGAVVDVTIAQDSLQPVVAASVAGPAATGLAAASQPVCRIGRQAGIGGFNGRIDELRLYGSTLSCAEVAVVYARDVIPGILETSAEKRNGKQKQQLLEYYIVKHGPVEAQLAWRQLEDARRREAEFEAAISTTLVMRDMDKPRDTFVFERGRYDKPGKQVTANVPGWLPALPSGSPQNRLGLAQWLVSPHHPLTARVTVNRYWQHFLGDGLVKTVNDLGTQGELPSHPELLDWLAVRFVEGGWDVKALHKLIVMSATYRQSSVCPPALRSQDPENRLLARGPRFRLSAEVIRDQALAASGLLVEHFGGPSAKPYQPSGLWEAVSYNAEQSYIQSQGADLYRRSLYTFWKRQAPPPAMLSFDGPTRETCTVKRARTNTPLQALVLQNDPTYVEAARVLASRLLVECGADTSARAQLAFRRILGRSPDAKETAALVKLFNYQLAEYRNDQNAAQALIGVGESAEPVGQRPGTPHDFAELAAWTTVVSAIFNLDETVTKP
jgi:hypothetical protein